MRFATFSLLLLPLPLLALPQYNGTSASLVDRAAPGCGKGRGGRGKHQAYAAKYQGGGGDADAAASYGNAWVAPSMTLVREVKSVQPAPTQTKAAPPPVQTTAQSPRPTQSPPKVEPQVGAKVEPKPEPEPAPAPVATTAAARDAPAPAAGGNGMTQADWITAHTNARAKYGAGPVTWSAGAEAQAKANVARHVSSCDLQHTDGGKFGENLMAGSGGNGVAKANDIVGGWMSESKNFNYNNPNGNNLASVGHFTAVVWKNVKGIGCAVGKCGASGTYVACCYDPFPNVIGSYDKQVGRPV